jgi:hypothetical protein
MRILIHGAREVVFPMADLKNLRVIRHADHHYAETSAYPADSHNNLISFMFKQREYQFEFLIPDAEVNEQFEAMVLELKETYADFYYASI